MKRITTKSRVHRILRHLAAFSQTERDLERFSGQITLAPGDELLGVYLNPPNVPVRAVAISSEALHLIERESVESILFEDIDHIDGPADKTDAFAVNIHVKNGPKSTVPILGGNERVRDAFEFLRFLDRVVADCKVKADS